MFYVNLRAKFETTIRPRAECKYFLHLSNITLFSMAKCNIFIMVKCSMFFHARLNVTCFIMAKCDLFYIAKCSLFLRCFAYFRQRH